MERLPKFLTQRLARGQEASDAHPKADALAAFAERQLPSAERQTVLAHLAVCAECRDVVGFVAEPMPQAQPRPFIHWRWIGVAAAASIVLAVTFWRPTDVSTPAYVTQTPKPLAVASAPKIDEPPAAHETKARVGKAGRSAAKSLPQSLQAARKEVPPFLEAAQTLASAEPDKVNSQQSELLPAVPRNVVGGATPETAPRAQSYKFGDHSSFAFFAGRASIRRAAAPMGSQSLWNISAQAGALIRSNDGGGIWTPITVDAKTSFFALSVAGQEIWTGGEGGVLFRSRDNGTTWNQVIVFDGSERLSDAITRIETRNDRQIQVATHSSAWVSLDGGQTWRKE